MAAFLRAALVCAALILLLFTGCMSDAPGGADDPGDDALPPRTPAGEETAGARRGIDVWAVGAPDGPASDATRQVVDFAAAARDFEPRDYEPTRVLLDPGDFPNPDHDLILAPTRPDGSPPWQFDPSIAIPDGPCPRPPFDTASFNLFDDAMEGIMDDESILTANLAVSDRCGLLYEQGYGILGPRPWAPSFASPANLDQYLQHVYEANGPDTMWRIASLSKPITSSVIHKMVDDGLIEYDDTVFCSSAAATTSPDTPVGRKCLLSYDPADGPGSVFATVTQPKRTITVEHLLQHNSGWDRDSSRNGDFMFMPFTVNSAVSGTLPPSDHDIVRWGLSQPVWFTPGNQGGALDAYSNFGFLLLQLIVEKWGDKSYLDYLRQDVFGPLGVPAADVQQGRSLPGDFDQREPYYPCGGTRSTPFPGETPDPVCAST